MKLTLRSVLSLMLLVLAAWQLGQGSYIYAKAQLAQWLIASAWQQTETLQMQIKPWPWADTWPVAKLVVPQHGIEQYVLAGVSGEALAFGPGYVFASAPPTESGHTMIAAHRDTHFSFLQDVSKGEIVTIYNDDGEQRDYVIQEIKVVDKTDLSWLSDDSSQYQLTLVTCYPFNSLRAGGRLRYVVRAVAQTNISV